MGDDHWQVPEIRATGIRLRPLLGVALLCLAVVVGAAHLFDVLVRRALDMKEPPDIDFRDPQIEQARRQVVDSRTFRLDEAALQLDGIAHRIGPRGREDRCWRGQHNVKVKDDVAVRCEVTLVEVYAFDGEFRPQAQRIVDSFGGVSSGAHTALAVYDERLGQTFRNFPHGYQIDDIGPAGVTEELTIEAWITLPVADGRQARHDLWLPRPCGSGEELCDVTALDLEAALAEARETDRWAVVLSTTAAYWVVGWD